MDNTPISAVTLPNNNRHLYFREQTGAIRQAAFSSSAQYWQTTIDARLPENARNNTPIAVMPTDLSEISTDVVLLYVNSTDQLDCVEWQTSDLEPCASITLPLIPVSPDSSHISAGHYDFNDGGEGILLTYQNYSRDTVLLLGHVKIGYKRWTWQDETEQLPTCSGDDCPYGNSTTCSMQSSTIFCLQGTNLHMCPANFTSANKFNLVCGKPLLNSANDLSSNNIGATYLGGVSTSPHLSFESAGEAAPFAMDNGFGGLLSIHNSSLQSSDRSLPPPKNTIPYDHIASTNSINSSKVYFHYQLNDATFVENLWDDTSGFWSPKNITNAT